MDCMAVHICIYGKHRSKKKEPREAPSFCCDAYCGEFAALMVAFPHIDVLNKLASLMNIHLFIYMPDMSIYGMG